MATLVPPPAYTFAPSHHLDRLFHDGIGGMRTDECWCAIVQTAHLDTPPPLLPVNPGLTRQERTIVGQPPRQSYRAWVTLVYGVPEMTGLSRQVPAINSRDSGIIKLPRGSIIVIWENPTAYYTRGITNAAWQVARLCPPPSRVHSLRGSVKALGPGVVNPRRLGFTVWVGCDLQTAALTGLAPLRLMRPRVLVLPRSNRDLVPAVMRHCPDAFIQDPWFWYIHISCGVRPHKGEARLALPSGVSLPLGSGFSAFISGPTDVPAITAVINYSEWFNRV